MTFARGEIKGVTTRRPSKPVARKRKPNQKDTPAIVDAVGSLEENPKIAAIAHDTGQAINTPKGIQNASVAVRLLDLVSGK